MSQPRDLRPALPITNRLHRYLCLEGKIKSKISRRLIVGRFSAVLTILPTLLAAWTLVLHGLFAASKDFGDRLRLILQIVLVAPEGLAPSPYAL